MQEIAKYSGCFVCGDSNDIGLRARFYFDKDRAFTEYVTEKRFEGYLGFFHGGITATLLDEVMIKALLAKGIYVMTVELTVRYKKTVATGQELFLQGFVEKENGRLYITRGEVRTGDNELVATATGKYIRARGELKDILLQSLDE